MQGSDSFDLYADCIEQGVFLGKAVELNYMLYMMKITGRLSPEECEELLRLARAKEPDQKVEPVRETNDDGGPQSGRGAVY